MPTSSSLGFLKTAGASPQGVCVSAGGKLALRGAKRAALLWALGFILSPLAAIVAGIFGVEINPIPKTERLFLIDRYRKFSE
jgi:hypothetical protein